MRRILHDVVIQCVEEGIMTHEKAQKYFRSGKSVSLSNCIIIAAYSK